MNVSNCINTEDYNYLINNQDIITTCQEALLENDLSLQPVIASDDLSWKDRNEPKEGYNIPPSPQGTADTNNPSGNGGFKDFSVWLNHVERQLDNVCYCKETKGNDCPLLALHKQKVRLEKYHLYV
jgi:hypothetical protein